jgi:hypothetical protein
MFPHESFENIALLPQQVNLGLEVDTRIPSQINLYGIIFDPLNNA